MIAQLKLYADRLAPQVKAAIPLVRGYAASSITLVISAGCQFAWFVLIARALGASEFGKLILIMALTNFTGALCGLGAPDSMVRQAARSKDEYAAMLGHSIIVIGVTGVVLTLFSAVVLCFLIKSNDSIWIEAVVMLLYSLSNVLLFRWIYFVEQAFIGLFQFRNANIVNAGFSILRLATAAVACLAFHVSSLGAWAVWLLGAHVLMSVICIAMIAPLGRPKGGVNRTELILGFHFTTPVALDALRQNVDRLVLGVVAPMDVLGSYGTAFRMADTTNIVVNALNRIVYPRFAKMKEAGARAVLPLAWKYLFAVIGLGGFTAIAVFVVAPYITMLLGHSFGAVTFDLRVLCWLVVLVSVRNVPYDILGAFDLHGLRALVWNTAIIVSTCALAAAVYFYGVAGALVMNYLVQLLLCAVLWTTLLRLAAVGWKPAAEACPKAAS